MSHLSVISRMTDQAAAEKFTSERSNPVSLKKPNPSLPHNIQNKENYNKENEHSSLIRVQKAAEPQSRNPQWMIDGSAKEEAQTRSLQQPAPQDVQGMRGAAGVTDSPFM